jgi:hypothetical protein
MSSAPIVFQIFILFFKLHFQINHKLNITFLVYDQSWNLKFHFCYFLLFILLSFIFFIFNIILYILNSWKFLMKIIYIGLYLFFYMVNFFFIHLIFLLYFQYFYYYIFKISKLCCSALICLSYLRVFAECRVLQNMYQIECIFDILLT